MVRFGPKLERKQMVLFRAVDIGAELFAMAAACARAQMLARKGNEGAVHLADTFCRLARQRIERHFDSLFDANDEALYKTAMRVLKGEHAWLEQGIVPPAPWPEPDAESSAERPDPRASSIRREAAGVGD
jgi:hypothetical protein